MSGDVERVFWALRRTKPRYADLYVRFAPLPDNQYGEYCGMIFLNPSDPADDGMVDTLVHEVLHFLEPEAPESAVRRRTRAVVESLTARQRKRIERFLATVR